ncbi:glycosyltransferase [Azospirillum sp.]|uniref:glycosyltransferase n=1 Tax=Azospirillum sp. TaxID=34012 RepID=UPI003D74FF2D
MSGFVFDRDRNLSTEPPAISVICINKNHGDYIEDTIFSVLNQKFDDFEFIISDGGSTDNSLEIIGKYKFITLMTGKDGSRGEGLYRALMAARGRYVMITTSTDGYLSRTWLQSVSKILDEDPKVSLVFGASVGMNSDGSLGFMTFPSAHDTPQMEQRVYSWIMNGLDVSYLPELNYCIRRDILIKLFEPSEEFPELNEIDPVLRVHFEFNRLGYLPRYLPVLANYGRSHHDQEQLSDSYRRQVAVYETAWKKYRADVMAGRQIHLLRDGKGQPFARVVVNS